MSWWLRFIVTLVLAPILWWAVTLYVGMRQGQDVSDWAPLFAALGEVYKLYTLPALVLLAFVLFPVDLLLRVLGIGLLSVVVSPLVAWLVALLVLTFVHDPRVQSAGDAVGLAVSYGLVWGLTTREPRRRRVRPTTKDNDPADADSRDEAAMKRSNVDAILAADGSAGASETATRSDNVDAILAADKRGPADGKEASAAPVAEDRAEAEREAANPSSEDEPSRAGTKPAAPPASERKLSTDW